ncbi:ABC transporter ATP-binding protein [Cytobacillus firmus]|uniref:Efflux ABC transporter, ATP-binding protein n=1 Tax=Cytobacillus firmus TaxID=1399 RepID=A0A800MX88_CYTFI|nr:ABC transporter ATP-binding protein [Cytobacillus firmus]KAF0824172.1 Efflux ABC transporter, ATP-binding protein [Cytobacillus firmus]
MEPKVLEVRSVSKKIKTRKLLHEITFDIEQGDICGFLGPNGAGKTTLIRVMMGLVKPSAGDVLVLGNSVSKNRKQALSRVGAIVETPIFFGHMSGRGNLRNLIKLHPHIPRSENNRKVEELLELVGLKGRGNDRVSSYSLGMKQRLGIAQALLGDPEVIILDEPANGLDPMGMKFLRELIMRLRNEKGLTFLISSHLLDELQHICNKIVMIHEGELKWTGRLDDLIGKARWEISCEQPDKALSLLKGKIQIKRLDSRTLQAICTEDELQYLRRTLAEENIGLTSIEKSERNLEEIFIELMAQ